MHKKSKLTGIFLIAFLQSTSVYCQDYKTNTSTDPPKASKRFDWKKIYTGGGLGIQFGQFVYIDVSPIIGYRITDQLSAGVSLSYQYFSNNRLPEFSSHTYGGGLFGQYAFTQNFFAHLEYQLLNSEFIEVQKNRVIYMGWRRLQAANRRQFIFCDDPFIQHQ